MSNFLLVLLLIVAVVLCVAAVIFIISLYEARQLEFTHEILGPDKNQYSCQPALSIAFFSDLHANNCKISDQELIKALFSVPCDLVLFGGDVCNSQKDQEVGLLRLSRIAQEAKALSIPCYAVRGNHDKSISPQEYNQTGFTLLENESVPIKGRLGHDYLLIGINDPGKGGGRPKPVPETHFAEYPQEKRILLVHNPEYIIHQKTPPYAYQLSGHFHGGQIYMPFHLEYKLFRKETLPREGIYKGHFYKDGVFGYISRGCGCVLIPLRFLSKPQITVLSLPLEESADRTKIQP